MIVLDTNVVSELMRKKPEPRVLGWVDHQDATGIYLTAITVAELFYGVARLPQGKRRREIVEQVEGTIDEDFADRVLGFDDVAARHYGDIVVHRERTGTPISMADAQIAAVCRSHAATIATRNVADFENTGVSIVNPWDDSPEEDSG